ncbi:MAG: hypothetical protein IJX02_05390 [Clostridia bacterium]|nr:hypothetical protein [Clostridia bacterium]
MYTVFAGNMELNIDAMKGTVFSLKIKGKELCFAPCPIFAARLRDEAGECHCFDSTEAMSVTVNDGEISYKGFGGFDALCVTVFITGESKIGWRARVDGVPSTYALEWIELPRICMPRLTDNDPQGGKILFPLDEGIIVSDESLLPRYEAEFPMSGSCFIFPNKISAQFLSYHFNDIGLYVGAHDPKRGFKGVDYYPYSGGVVMTMRIYSGVGYGENYETEFPVVWQECTNDWKSAAEIYRAWFEENLPENVRPLKENRSLPQWYKENPLIVTYPVRGVHDMDKMEPNALFPYTNALPILERIKSATGARIMALLMHWEGTAPWAPPYVWPPFGGEDLFNEFRDALHKKGDLLGVYCSGFGYTKQSTLIESYNCEEQIKRDNVLLGVCHSPQNKPELGKTCCPYQRYGYDLCPASHKGRELLDEGYLPLFKSGIDYAQILDQNHGGGQYMCYARDHSHPPMPGEWMTTSMQALLKEWNSLAPNMLFGCESAAAEPFIGNLLMSDNRFELNYPYGTVVPLYAYLYHEYVRNFMGNQCGCPFDTKLDTLRYRLSYSFSIGDIMTLTLAPSGELMTHWSTRDFDNPPNMEKALLLIKNLLEFYENGAKKYLYAGKMCASSHIECGTIEIPMNRGKEKAVLPRLLSSCWEAENGKKAYIVVNPEDKALEFSLEGEKYTVPPLNAITVLK